MRYKRNEWIESLIFSAVIIAVLYLFFWPYQINGDSMENTLKGGDRVCISKAYALMHKIKRGDIVVLNVTIDGKIEHIIKRVIAMDGDELKIHDGKVVVNGKELEEKYIKESTSSTWGDVDLKLGALEYFVMGDNRAKSEDSRVFGIVKNKQILGKAVLRWYPFEHFGKF